MSNFKSIGQGVRGLRPPEIGGFPLALNVALTTVLRTNVLHCDSNNNTNFKVKKEIICAILYFYCILLQNWYFCTTNVISTRPMSLAD